MKMKLSFVVLAALLFIGLTPASSSAYIGISVGFAPPAIPIYTQPYCPAPGYIWTPGYWAWDGFGYYWVPGVWVAPPRIGFLWTPGYWGYNGSHYFFNDGYWGPTVGFYGGINYGFGYGGHGYYGGHWAGNTFLYNTAVTRVNTSVIKNTYVNKNFVTATSTRASFNGPGGATAKATAQELAAAKAERIPATSVQQSRVEAAKNNPDLHAKNNHGKPKAEAIKALDRDTGAQAGAGKAQGGAVANEKPEFGHKKGDASTRTTGSQNKAFGKARPADAQSSHAAAKTARAEKAAIPRAHKAVDMKSNRHANDAATAHRGAQRPQIMSHRRQAAPIRQAGPAAGTHAKGQPAQPDKKKKKPGNEGPGGRQ